MPWTMYTAIYELRSPLHIGYHKVGNLQRTRYYIPARNLWGAVTEALTRRGFATEVLQKKNPNAYAAVGNWVRAHIAFGYWFVMEKGNPLSPNYQGNRLNCGLLPVAEFERRYLEAHVTTALDAATTSAQMGSLHEVEFISPYHPIKPADGEPALPTRIGGWVFLDETARPVLGEESKWRSWLGDLQIGGERRYGFGQMHLFEWDEQVKQEKGYTMRLDGKRPQVNVQESYPLLAHAATDDVRGKGIIETLVGRETDVKRSNLFGLKLTQGIICWVPGTILESSYIFEMSEDGIWKTIS